MLTARLLTLAIGLMLYSALPAVACSADPSLSLYCRPDPTYSDLTKFLGIALKAFQSPFMLCPLALGSAILYWKVNADTVIEALGLGVITSCLLWIFLHHAGSDYLKAACSLTRFLGGTETDRIIVGLTVALSCACLVAQSIIFMLKLKPFGGFYLLCSLAANILITITIASACVPFYRITLSL